MPQVPYQPYPNVQPEKRGTPQLGVSTPIAAFGGTVAAALEGLGKGIEGAGNEIFARAKAMKDLQNETERTEADAKYMMRAGELHVNFSSLEGQDAVKAYPQYIKDLQDSRKAIRDGLSNQAVQKMFDANSLSTMGRTIFNGAGHAAAQQKQWSIKSTNAEDDMIDDDMYSNPKDDIAFQRNLERKRANAEKRNALIGGDETMLQDAIQKTERTAWTRRITGLAKTDPPSAEEMFRANRTKLGALADQVEEKVRSQNRAISSRILSDDNMAEVKRLDAEGKPQQSEREMLDAVRAKAEKLAPDDKLFPDYAEQRARQDYNQWRVVKHNDQLETKQNGDQIIIQYQPKNLEAFRATPNGELIYSKMGEHDQLGLPAKIARYNSSLQQRTDQAVLNKLRGMAEESPLEFMAVDPTKFELSQKDIGSIQKLQQEKRKNMNTNPHVAAAYNMMRSSLPTDFDSKSNEDVRHEFKGALQEAIIVETAQLGKPPNREQLKTIGQNVLKQIVTDPGSKWTNWIPLIGGPTKEQFYHMAVPAKAAEAIKQDWLETGRGEPADEQIRNEYIRAQYLELFKKKSTKPSDRMLPGPP